MTENPYHRAEQLEQEAVALCKKNGRLREALGLVLRLHDYPHADTWGHEALFDWERITGHHFHNRQVDKTTGVVSLPIDVLCDHIRKVLGKEGD